MKHHIDFFKPALAGLVVVACLAASARTNLVTQYVAPVAAFNAGTGWENRVQSLDGEYGTGSGIEFTRRSECDGAYNYGVQIDTKVYCAFSRWVKPAADVSCGQATTMPASFVRSAASRPRYLYQLHTSGVEGWHSRDTYVLDASCTETKPNVTADDLETQSIKYGYDTSSTYSLINPSTSIEESFSAEYVQATHVDYVYEVTFYPNGGSGSYHTQQITNSGSLVWNRFNRDGFAFANWNTQPSGGGTKYEDNQSLDKAALDGFPAEGLVLYAQWTAQQYDVTLDPDNPSGSSQIVKVNYGQPMPSVATSIPIRAGYAFRGYFSEKEGGGTQYYKADGTSARNWDRAAGTTLYAAWGFATYTVTLYAPEADAGADYTKTVTASYLQRLPSGITIPTRVGYDFTGYFDGVDSAGVGTGNRYYLADGTTTNDACHVWDTAKDATIRAGWTAKTLTVTFDPGAGATIDEDFKAKTVTYAGTYGDLPPGDNVHRTGYALDGWTLKPGGTKKLTSSTKVETPTNHSLYAKWTANQYTVGLYLDPPEKSWETYGEQGFTYGVPQGLMTMAEIGYEKSGYTFQGWRTNQTDAAIAYADGAVVSNLTTSGTTYLYALWRADPYYVAYSGGNEAAEGTMPVSTFYRDEEARLPPNAFVCPGRSFEKWRIGTSFKYLQDQAVVTNLFAANTTNTLTACWTSCVYRIRFDANCTWTNAEGVAVDATYGAAYASLPEYGTVPSVGRAHLGWRTADGNVINNGDTVAILSNQTFTAVWTNAPFALTFDANGGTIGGVAVTNVTDRYWDGEEYGACGGLPGSDAKSRGGEDAPAPLPAPVREGWTFAGWWTGRDAAESVQHVDATVASLSNKVLYARWQENLVRPTCTVTYLASDKLRTSEWTTNVLQGTALGAWGGGVPAAAENTNSYVVAWWKNHSTGEPVTEETVVEAEMTLEAVPTYKAWTNWFPPSEVAVDPAVNTNYPWTVETNSALAKAGAPYTLVSTEMSGNKSSASRLNMVFRKKLDWYGFWHRQEINCKKQLGGVSTMFVVDDAGETKFSQTAGAYTNYSFAVIDGVFSNCTSFIYRRGSTDAMGETNCAWVSDIAWSNAVVVSPLAPWSEDSVRTNLTFTTGGTKGWTNAVCGAESCIQVTDLPAARSAWVRATTPAGRGILSFTWKANTEKGYCVSNGTDYAWWNYLEFKDNEGVLRRLDGSNDWTTVVLTNDARTAHTYEWRLVNGASNTVAGAGAWLKDVTWEVLESAVWPDPRDQPGETETEKVQSALTTAGFTGSSAALVTNTAMYGVVTVWSVEKGVSPEEMSAARTPLLSSALGADGLLDGVVSSNDVAVASLVIAGGQATVSVTVNGLGLFKDLKSLSSAQQQVLMAAVGVLGGYGLSSFSYDNLTLVGEEVGDDRVRLTVEPKKQDGDVPTLFFFRPTVR